MNKTKMKINFTHTRLSLRYAMLTVIVSLSILAASCSQDENLSGNNLNLPGLVNLQSVRIAGFSSGNTRALPEAPVVVDTIKIAEDLYAEISIGEVTEVSTRGNDATNLSQNTQFRMLVLDKNDNSIKADLIYKIKDGTGKAEIVSGSGEGYKESDGNKYLQLTPGKTYKMLGFSDGTSNTPEKLTNPMNYEWLRNYMKFSTDLSVSDGINPFGPTFQHMNAAMQIVINTSKTGSNVTAASASVWQENDMPTADQWDYLTDRYADTPTTTDASETDGADFTWSNPNSQNATSDLQYLIPGNYGSLKLKFKNITVGKVDYNNIAAITLDPAKTGVLQRNKKYIITVSFIPPFKVEITDNLTTGGVNKPRIVTVTASGALPPYTYDWTIICNGETTRFSTPSGQNTYQHSLNGDYKRMDYEVQCVVHDSSGKQVGVSLKSVLKQIIRKTAAEVPVSEVPWMQNWDSSQADAEIAAGGAQANRIRYVRDQRDNTIYRIKKMADGRWWMMQGMAWEGLTPIGVIDPGVSTSGNPPSVKVRSSLQGDILYRQDMIHYNRVCPAGWRTPTYGGDYPNLLKAIAPANVNIYKTDVTNATHWENTTTAFCLSYNNETYPRDFSINAMIYSATNYCYLQNNSVVSNNRWGHNKFSLRCVKN